jgi:phosphate transport system substrate-binding protein
MRPIGAYLSQVRRRGTLAVGLAALGAAALLAACDTAAVSTPAPVTITVAGSTAMRPVLRELTEEYARQHPNVLFSLRGGGSTLGEQEARDGEVTIGASTLFPPDGQADSVQVAALATPAPVTPISPTVAGVTDSLVRTPIGIDGLAVIVHPENSVTELSLLQLRDLYSGRVIDWQALGSDVGEVVLVSREDGSGSRLLFEQRVMGAERVSLTAVVMPTSEDVVSYVAKNPQAIGYVSRGHVAQLIAEEDDLPSAGVADEPAIKVLRIEGQLPSRQNLASQTYPLTQPMYLVTKVVPTGRIRQFVDFALSPAGQSIVARYHVPIR